jgi:hypothetical protein
MRKSQIIISSTLGAIALLIVLAIVGARFIVSELGSGEYAGESPRADRAAGPVASETRNLSGFDRIDARGMWEVELRQGTAWDVALSYPENAADRLDVRVEDGRLILEEKGRGWSWFGGNDVRLEASITMPALASVDLSGASELTLSGFSGDRLDLTASGATEINGSNGSYRELRLVVSGAGDVDLNEIVVDDARVVLSGAGDIKLNMNGGVLAGSVSGAGHIAYRGAVREENVVTSGFSSVDAVDED